MKITRTDAAQPHQGTQPASFKLKVWHFLLLGFLLVLTFSLGAFVYRTGALTPLTAYLKGVFTQGEVLTGLPEPVQEAAVAVQDEVRMYVDNGLPTLYIDLPYKSYQKLLEKRDEALKIGVLNTTDADFVPGKIELQDGPKLDAKLRLKGDWTDHLEGEKWSFRIHLKEDGQIFGTTQFSIQTPAARNFLYEWAFHQNLQQEGLLTPRYEFINVLVNGKMLGIYALEENFAPELLESQGRRQGVILRFNEDPMWNNISTFRAQGFAQESTLSVTTLDSADINVFQESKIAANPLLAAEAEAARGMLRAFQAGERPASEIFDVEQMGLFFALHDLWRAEHGVAWHNLRFYYNPVTARLEPVAFDSMPNYTFVTEPTLAAVFIKYRIFNDPAVRTAYARQLERITRPEYVDALEQALAPKHDQLQSALRVEFPDSAIPQFEQLAVDWAVLKKNALLLSLELRPADMVRGAYTLLNTLPESTGTPTLSLDLVNLMILPVEVTRVEVNGQAVATGSASVVLPPVMDPASQPFESKQITIPVRELKGLDPLTPPTVTVYTRIAGLEREAAEQISGTSLPDRVQVGPAPVQPTLAQALAQHPFLSANPADPTQLSVAQGAWDVTGDLILPANSDLIVPAGVSLRFAENAILYSSGAVRLLGAPNAPVLLTAQQDGWGGIVVVQAAHPSTWQYANVEKTTGIDRQGWTLTGGITFYKSDITLDQVLLGNNQTEDAINVIHAVFKFIDSEFSHTFADAFDSDFSQGEIRGCTFHDIAGDAIDVSGTNVTVSDTRMANVVDKGISAGEKSTMTVSNVRLDGVGIGIASKDLSRVTLVQADINNARFSALAAYIKKPVYGPAWIDAKQVTIRGTEKAAVAQKGSTIVLEGKPVETVDLDVDLLYQEGILGN